MKITNNIPKPKTAELRTLRLGECFYLPHESPELAYVVGYYNRDAYVIHVTRLFDGNHNKLGHTTAVVPVSVEITINPLPEP